MKKILGLDLGTTSIGWALVNEAETADEKSSIIKLGVRVNPLSVDEQLNFQAGKPITTNAGRTLKRSMRRNLQRYKLRREDLIDLLRKNNIISDDSVLIEDGKNTTFETWALRAKAAENEVSLEEFARVLLHINKKRGYKSSRKVNSDEDGQLIDGMETARILFEEGLTPGQHMLALLKEGKKSLPDYYSSDLQAEFDLVWSFQGQFYPQLTDELKEKVTGRSGRQTWAVLGNEFHLVGIKRSGKRDAQKLENCQWRSKALNEKVEPEVLAIVLQEINGQMVNCSGYLGKISDKSKALYFSGQTVGQYQYDELKADRHHSLANEVFYRQDYIDEFNRIWDTQAKYHKELTSDLKAQVRNQVLFYQRPLKSQKGLVSFCEFENWKSEIEVDGKKKIKIMGHKVCPKSSPLFQDFRIWQRLNDIVVTDKRTGGAMSLSEEEKNLVFKELSIKDKLSKKEILEILFDRRSAKNYDMNFKDVEGNRTQASLFKAYGSIVFKTKGIELELSKMSYEAMLGEIEPVFRLLGIDTSILAFESTPADGSLECQSLFKLWHLLYSYQGDDSKTGDACLIAKLKSAYGFPEECGRELAKVTFEPDYGNLCTRAIKKILPFLKDGQQYSDACLSAGYRHSAASLTREEIENKVLKERLEQIPKNSLRNPVVEKILNQMINVVNSVCDVYGKPDEIRLEMARELKQSAEERNKTTKAIADASKAHEKIRTILQSEFGLTHISRNDIIRYKLYAELESNGYKTLYSNTYIPREDLFTNRFDIEHIIPQSRCFDDSFSNKTLELRDINIEKGNSTAIDYVQSKYGDEGLADYRARIDQMKGILSNAKIQNLLRHESEIPDDFINRDLRDSQYIARMAKDMLLELVRDVVTTTGSITDRLREDWQLVDVMKELNWSKYEKLGLTHIEEARDGQRIRRIDNWTKRNDHRHHAMDALTIAFTKRSYIQYLNTLNARTDKTSTTYAIEQKELYRDSKKHLRFRSPIVPVEQFRSEAKAQLDSVLVSIKAKNKVVTRNVNSTKKNGGKNKTVQLTPRGQLHNETVYGSCTQYIRKEEKVGPSFNIEKINLVVKGSYRYALMRRLAEFGGDPAKAFAGKNALSKNPLFVDDSRTDMVPERVLISIPETVYTIRKEVSPDLKIEKVVDSNVRRILESRLAEFGGDPKAAFSNLEENPIWLNRDSGICIKRVTITGVNNAVPLHDKRDHSGKPILNGNNEVQKTDYVSTSNNHHVAIYLDGAGNLQEKVVSFYEATQRMVKGLPAVDQSYRKDDGWRLLFTMKQNEYFVFPDKESGFNPNEIDLLDSKNYALISPNLFRVQKLAAKNYTFRHHLETNVEEEKSLRDLAWKRIQSLPNVIGIVKVRVDHLGRIVQVGEY